MGAGPIMGGIGLIQNYLAQRSADDARNRAMSLEEQKAAMEAEINRRRLKQFDEINKTVEAARKGGVYDPNAWAKNYATDFNRQAGVLQDRVDRNLTEAGYQPTDSEYKYNTGRLARTLEHDLAVGQIGARQNAVTAEANALKMAEPGILPNVQSQLPAYLMMQSQNQQPDWASSLSGILPLIQSWGKNKGGANPWGSTGPDGQSPVTPHL